MNLDVLNNSSILSCWQLVIKRKIATATRNKAISLKALYSPSYYCIACKLKNLLGGIQMVYINRCTRYVMAFPGRIYYSAVFCTTARRASSYQPHSNGQTEKSINILVQFLALTWTTNHVAFGGSESYCIDLQISLYLL